jgi:hypothetical protein
MKICEPQLPKPTTAKLQEAAESVSISDEQLSRSIEEKLAQMEKEFCCWARYTLQKNADLYRRLA